MNSEVLTKAEAAFTAKHDSEAAVIAYAPGRVEILGNHTDYNEGFVLSCAINTGTFFLVSPSSDNRISLTAGDIDETTTSCLDNIKPSDTNRWANYIKGVIAGLMTNTSEPSGFDALFLGNVPLGSGLSSSAALEISTALAVAKLWNVTLDPIDAAKIGQKAEHDYAGAKCGLLDQISSLYGKDEQLVVTDFRDLNIRNTPFSSDYVFLTCNTHAKHALVDGEYNERRHSCEAAAYFFSSVLDHPVTALRDVSMEEWDTFSPQMNPVDAKRAAHIIGENERVLKGIAALKNDDFETFGTLMYQSHESSRYNFENSCPELDFIVDKTKSMPGVLGARLSGGGFGGSVIALLHARDVETTSKAISSAYQKEFNETCEAQLIIPSAGAQVIRPE